VNRRWTDRILGIVLGLVIGLGVLVYFVFVHSEGTIDAPKVNEGGATAGQTTTPSGELSPAHPGSQEQPAGGGAGTTSGGEAKPGGGAGTAGEGGAKTGAGEGGASAGESAKQRQIPVVKVIGGAPPTDSGPKQLTFHKGEKVRFEIETSEPFAFEIRGLGIEQSIEESSVISFKATKTGQFPVIATATLIGVADLIIKPAR
jgi:hypothetical protein